MSETDFIRLVYEEGFQVTTALPAPMSWPPPEVLTTWSLMKGDVVTMHRVSMSEISDEEIVRMPNVARGAVYHEVVVAEIDTSIAGVSNPTLGNSEAHS